MCGCSIPGYRLSDDDHTCEGKWINYYIPRCFYSSDVHLIRPYNQNPGFPGWSRGTSSENLMM